MMPVTRKRNYTWFVGIDVGKAKLDFAILNQSRLILHKEVANDKQSIREFITELKTMLGLTIAKSIFCLENIGVYAYHLLTELRSFKARIVQKGSLHLKRSMGLLRGKSDKTDSIRIAQYIAVNWESQVAWAPRRPVIDQLDALMKIRDRLQKCNKILSVPLKEVMSFNKKSRSQVQYCKNSIQCTKEDIKKIDKELIQLINSDDELKRLFAIITSVDFVGPQTAIQIIVCTNEFKWVKNPKQFACYAGIAPFPKSSGTFEGRKRTSVIGNSKLKSLLHICAMGTLRSSKGGYREYFLRKTDVQGKAKMSVVNVIRNKIILRIFACVNQGRMYEESYTSLKLPRCTVAEEVDLVERI